MRIIFVLIVIFLAILLSIPIPVSQDIKNKIIDLTSPLVSGIDYLFNKIFSIKDIFTTVRENNYLRRRLDELSVELNELKEGGRENERLRELLDLRKTLPYDTIACRIIARDAGAWYRTVIIDKGTNSGIDIDMPVLSNGGVIGRVIEAGIDTARVLLITDINSSIGGLIQDTRTVGLVEGTGTGRCIINLLPKNIDAQAGDIVVTSGLGRIFPKGLVIGTITELASSGQGLYKTAELILAADMDRLEEVLIVKIKKDYSHKDTKTRRKNI